MDVDLHRAVSRACDVPDVMVVGLHLQHGGECDVRDFAEHAVELVQYCSISAVTEAVGSVAWFDCGLDHHGDESGTIGFCAMAWHDRRA